MNEKVTDSAKNRTSLVCSKNESNTCLVNCCDIQPGNRARDPEHAPFCTGLHQLPSTPLPPWSICARNLESLNSPTPQT